MRQARYFLFLGLGLVIALGFAGWRRPGFRTDWEGVNQLLTYPFSPKPWVNEVRVVVTGPQRDFDHHQSLNQLLRMPPVWETTEQSVIQQLEVDLRETPTTQYLSTEKEGYTVHLLLLDLDARKAMHFRVFTPSLTNTGPAMVYPRSTTGFGYLNDKILARIVPRLAQANRPP